QSLGVVGVADGFVLESKRAVALLHEGGAEPAGAQVALLDELRQVPVLAESNGLCDRARRILAGHDGRLQVGGEAEQHLLLGVGLAPHAVEQGLQFLVDRQVSAAGGWVGLLLKGDEAEAAACETAFIARPGAQARSGAAAPRTGWLGPTAATGIDAA